MEIKKDRIAGGVLLLVALAFAIGAFTLSKNAAADVQGPMLYPLGLAIVLAVLAIILMFTGKDAGAVELTKKMLTKGFLPSIGVGILYIVLLPYLGFVLDTIGMLLTFFWMKGERKWWLNLTIAIVATVGNYLLFGTMLNVPLKLTPWFIR
jgi:putative tricarboxylic transport membrane protein